VSISVKHGDKYPIQFVVNADLTGATVRLLAKPNGGDTLVLDSTIPDPAGGVVEHMLTGELDVGDYRIEVEATRDGEVITFPNTGTESLHVEADLG